MQTRSAYARADVGDQRVKHKARVMDAGELADVGRALDRYFARQERGMSYGHRQETRHPFVRKRQAPPCQSLRAAILLSFKASIRMFKAYGMVRDPNTSSTSTEGWADSTSIEDNTID